jgi:glutamate dehydrogenase
MGITARGAWECVKRHFRELGLDTQEQAFTVAGIGDMSGDVFGNGMLLSAHTRLVAAFNHQHVFLDPEPDAARSFAERRRLFDLPRSGWNDYDTRTLSRGGGVFPRTAKVIPLAPECRQLLGIDATEAAPNEVIRAILRLPVDLLWNGGIGTYVKAGTEPQSAAGDRGNDAVRVDGRELRARVVGEGGNLGFTQLGRVEYALHGGRINTDFIDNSAGVNTSDLEVNLKILTTTIEARGGLRRRDRDRLLAGLTGDIAALVLRNNYLQGQALSGLQRDALQRLPEMQHLMRTLERAGELNRSVEYLPQDAVLEERRKQGHGLTRPELAVLLSYSKISLKHALIASDAPEDPYLSRELERYFPPVLRRRFAGDIPRHPLRREIVVTALTNSIVNRMGPSFVTRAQEETGASAAEIARAYTIAREVFDMRRCWESIEALDNRVPAAVQYGMHSDTARLLRHATYWLLRHRRTRLGVEAGVADYGDAITELTQRLPALLSGGDLGHYAIRRDALLQEGVPAALASRVALADMLDGALDIAELARQQRIPLADAAAAHVAVGENLGLDWLRRAIDSLQVDGAWQVIARNELREAARQARRAIAREALAGKGRRTVAQRLAAWATSRATALESWQRLLADLRAMDKPDFATLSVGVAAARELAG